MMRKVVVITAILVSLGIGFSTNERASGTMPTYERVDPPIVWDVDLPEGEYQVGDIVTARINFYFYEMPEHGQWDPVWQARFYLYKPRGLDRHASELTPISVGTRESYEASFEITQPGAYVLEACVNAVTAPKDWLQPSGRGSIFSYKSGKRGSRFSAPSGTAPDTGWQSIKGTSAMIRVLSREESETLGVPGTRATLRRRGDNRVSLSDLKRIAEKDSLIDISCEALADTDRLSFMKVVPRLRLRIRVEGITSIDSVSLSSATMGRVDQLDSTSFSYVVAASPESGRIVVHSGSRKLWISTSLYR